MSQLEAAPLVTIPPARGAWGPRGVVIGGAAAFCGLLFVAAIVAVVVTLRGPLDLGHLPLGLVYALFFASQAVFMATAWIAAYRYGGAGAQFGLNWAGWRSAWRGIVAAIGLVIVLTLYHLLLERVAPSWCAQIEAEAAAQKAQLSGPWPLMFLAAAVIAPLGEELFFRGFIYQGLAARWPAALAIGCSALLFGLVHGMLWNLPALTLIGVTAALLLRRSGSLWPAFTCHATFNALSLLIDRIG